MQVAPLGCVDVSTDPRVKAPAPKRLGSERRQRQESTENAIACARSLILTSGIDWIGGRSAVAVRGREKGSVRATSGESCDA